MAIANPCCCLSLQKGSKIVAAVDIILASIPLIIFLTNYIPETVGPAGKPFTDFNTGIWTIFIVFLTADIGLSILLLIGSKAGSPNVDSGKTVVDIFFFTQDRCTKKLKAWFYIRIVTTGLTVLIIIIAACFEISMKLIVYDIFHTLYRLYSLWVIYVFIGEIIYEEIFYTKKSSQFPSSPGNTLGGNVGTPTPPTAFKHDGFENGGGQPFGYGTVNNAYIP